MSAGRGAVPPLSEAARQRYARHLVIPELGEAAQRSLAAAAVLVAGAGGLGSPAALYLAAAGVGRLGILDSDVVELSNLQRQVLHHTPDLGAAKTDSAAAKLRALNPDVAVQTHRVHIDDGNAGEVVREYDVVVGAVDNFPARYALNDACVAAGTVLVEGAILRFVGLAMTIRGGHSACYRCVFPEAPPEGVSPSPAQAGVFGPVPGVIGAVQAAEAIKVLTGVGRPLYDRLLEFDALDMAFQDVAVRRDPGCPACGAVGRGNG